MARKLNFPPFFLIYNPDPFIKDNAMFTQSERVKTLSHINCLNEFG